MTKEQKLDAQVKKQKETITSLSRRMSKLVDRLAVLEEDVGLFKGRVSNDIKQVIKLYEILQKGEKNV